MFNAILSDYPYLQEAVVIGVSTSNAKYYVKVVGKKKQIREHILDDEEREDWSRRIGRVEYMSSKRLGLEVGKTEVGLHVCVLRGMKKTPEGAYVKEYVNPAQEDLVPVQMTVIKVSNPDPRYIERPPPPVTEEFPINSKAFFLGGIYYGALATVSGHYKRDGVNIEVIVPQNPKDAREPMFGRTVAREQMETIAYTPSYIVSRELKIDPLVLSKLTSSLTVQDKGLRRVNLGLNLKFEAKQQKVLGYSRKNRNGQWEFSDKAIDLIIEYIRTFPKFVALLHNKNGKMHFS